MKIAPVLVAVETPGGFQRVALELIYLIEAAMGVEECVAEGMQRPIIELSQACCQQLFSHESATTSLLS